MWLWSLPLKLKGAKAPNGHEENLI